MFVSLSMVLCVFSEHEDECFDCGDGGKLIMCSKSGCSKCYHLSCLTIENIPYGDWICPWHFCDDCGKAAMVRCQECSNSFCLAHAPGQITKMADGRTLCYRHQERNLNTTSDLLCNNTPSDPNLISRDLLVPSGILSVDAPPIPSCFSVDPSETPTNPRSVASNSMSAPLNPTSIPVNLIGDPRNHNNSPESVNVCVNPDKLDKLLDVSTNLIT